MVEINVFTVLISIILHILLLHQQNKGEQYDKKPTNTANTQRSSTPS